MEESKGKESQIRGILKLLIMKELEKSSASGYDLIKRISNIVKKPSPGSIYPLLKELTNSGFLNVKIDGNRKLYSLSEKGKLVLEEASKREKEAILKKIEVLESSGIITTDEAEKMLHFINFKRELMMKLAELRNWREFIIALSKAIEKSKDEVESIIEDAIKKLREIE